MRGPGFVVTLVLLSLAVGACAPALAPPPPVVTAPRFPEFVKPALSSLSAGSEPALRHERVWAFLQAGDLSGADKEIAAALKGAKSAPADPGSTVLDADAAYLALARKDAQTALTRFDRVLARQPTDVSILVGRGLALEALNRNTEALEQFRSALARDPSLGDIARRVEVLRFRGLERTLSDARQAAQSGRTDDAIAAYRSAIEQSPDSAFLYRELADIERQRGQSDDALSHYRQAVAMDAGDAASSARIAELLEASGDFEGALRAYDAALAVGPDEQLEARRTACLAKMELARLPAQYRAIDASPQATRGDLAALIGVRLAPWLQRLDQRDAGIITDIRTHWAERWILDVARVGVMDPFANHAFEPAGIVSRADLAQVASRILGRTTDLPRPVVAAWQDARLTFPDVPTSHTAYAAVSTAVAAGVLTRSSEGRFEPSRTVTGGEAAAAVDRLRALLAQPPARLLKQ
jgi:tetratricopeptide (TPR) repeat protein